MKKLLVFVILISLIMVPNVDAKNGAKKKTRMHPSFAFLLKTQPRDREIKNPMVPRISAEDAYGLYKTNQAIFIAVGEGTAKLGILGAIPMRDEQVASSSVVKKLKKLKNKYIIIYCV